MKILTGGKPNVGRLAISISIDDLGLCGGREACRVRPPTPRPQPHEPGHTVYSQFLLSASLPSVPYKAGK